VAGGWNMCENSPVSIACCISGVLARTMSVSTVPGANAFTRMPSGANCAAIARVNDMRPALAAAYIATFDENKKAPDPEKLAIRVTRADGTVAVASQREADTVVLSVTDGCGGIPEEDLPRVFDTGWRGSHARTPPAGAGLGLAIVRGIVTWHGGPVTAGTTPEGWCRFSVRIPLDSESG